MNTIIIFSKSGEFIRQCNYRTATIAKKQYKHFLKYGAVCANTYKIIEGAKFELITTKK
jgi:dihydroneopterin aldolase